MVLCHRFTDYLFDEKLRLWCFATDSQIICLMKAQIMVLCHRFTDYLFDEKSDYGALPQIHGLFV